MPQDSSLVGVFDLNSQTGVMSVLASIRASTLSTAEKNELRDLVFLYTNGGGDVSVKISLEQKLMAHGITPVALKKAGPAGPTLSFGSYRPTPNFKAPAVSASVSTPIPPAPAAPAAVFVAPAPVVAPTPTLTPASAPVAAPAISPLPPPPPMPVSPVVVAPAPVSAPVAAPAPTPMPQAAAPAPATPAPVPASVLPTGEVNYLERIRQIKTAVNSKVGNPVNLVDIDNQVGREYMNALLEAMKKLSAGAVSEMDPAMQRLEAAFAAVEVAIKNHGVKEAAVPVPPTPTATQIPVPTPPVTPPQPEPVLAQPVPVTPLPPTPPRPSETATPLVEVPLPTRDPVPTPPVSVEQRSTIPLASIPTVVRPELLHKEISAESGYDKAGSNTATPTPPSASLADSTRILTPTDLPDAASLETGDKGDPLFTKEVDDGLDQLLSDWTLFKKSGLFGTGPKGREHPLFKKIAELQVPLLLAGRFDGATQEIRQSVTDYMNGWRYEQGIIYQPGETFEKYLRRVIKHILDLQKKRK